jgi:hypothetical protein
VRALAISESDASQERAQQWAEDILRIARRFEIPTTCLVTTRSRSRTGVPIPQTIIVSPC